MSTPHILTEAEHNLLDNARPVPGHNLFEFLLSGLGEPCRSRGGLKETKYRSPIMTVT